MQHQMEGRDAASLPPSACPLRRGGKTEARVGRRDGDRTEVAWVRSLTDTAAAQLCTAALVLVLGRRGGQSFGPDLANSETSARLISCRPLCEDLRGCLDPPRGRGQWCWRASLEFLRTQQDNDGLNKTFGLTMLGHPACDPKGRLKLHPPLSGSKVSFSSNKAAFE